MDSIKIQGLKSLGDTGFIPIKPLTILLGENSSGKSTFIRTFPLFKQSLNAITRGPILWYGSYVDFGSFENALSKYSQDNLIKFAFKTRIEKLNEPRNYFFRRLFESLEGNYEFEFSIKAESTDSYAQISSLKIKVGMLDCSIEFTRKKKVKEVSVDGVNFGQLFESSLILKDSDKSILIPTITYPVDENTYIYNYRHHIPPHYSNNKILLALDKIVKRYCHPKSDQRELTLKILNLDINDSVVFYEKLVNLSNTKTWRSKIQCVEKDSKKFNEIRCLVLLYKIPSIIIMLNEKINGYFSNVQYIAPIRANAERYYRAQDLSVNEVDYQGKNLAMFVNNLSGKQKKSFTEWLTNNFGFYIEAVPEGGHLSLKLKYSGSSSFYNITDMGFGFSQILPILTQVWFSSVVKKSNNDYQVSLSNPKTIIVEQPELHLHPRFQAKLVDAFAKVIKVFAKEDIKINIIIETHSETIINQIGHRIYKEQLASDDVGIVIFEKNNPDEQTVVNISNYDSDGNLEKWPWGFFDVDLD